jgi:ADP-heptose:LPS heptosyltransferase
VGHDSGITHLAAALGLPCLVLWSNSIEEIWRPQGESISIVREQRGVEAISVERVLRELAGFVVLSSKQKKGAQ